VSKDAPYTVTVYVAAPGTPLRSGGTSAAGHMYLSVSHEGHTNSYGFAPIKHGATSGPGDVTKDDVGNYIKPYYARTMEITKDQYDKIRAYAKDPEKYGFDKEYGGLKNSCIDFSWGALNHAGLHRKTLIGNDRTYEGALRPLSNKGDIESIPAPVPGSRLNKEEHHPMPSRNWKQWLITENGGAREGGDTRAGSMTPADAGHRDNPLLGQIRDKVADLDAANGRSFDATSERVSASLLALAKDNGLSRVDHVLLGERTAYSPAAHNILIVQGERNDPAHLRAAMPTALAAQTSVEASFEQVEQIALKQAHRVSAQAQANPSQLQEQDAAMRRMG
jgi:hypothetical protein